MTDNLISKEILHELKDNRSVEEQLRDHYRDLFRLYRSIFVDVGTGITTIGNGTNYIQIGSDGSLTFVGTAGLVFGSIYGNDILWPQANAVQNTWYNIVDTDMADGQLHGVTHDGNGKLTVTEPGKYSIVYSLSVECDTQNKHIESGIEINGSGSAVADGRQHYHLPNVAAVADTEFPMAGTAILDLADNSTIEIAIRTTDAGTPDLLVDHLCIVVAQVGGT